MSSYAYHRPFNGSSTTTANIKSSNERGVGRTLSDLLRSRDKLILSCAAKQFDDDNVVVADYEQQHEEIGQVTFQIISTLNVLNETIRNNNGGLFGNNLQRAVSYYKYASERSSSSSALASSIVVHVDGSSTEIMKNGGDNASGGGGKKKRKRGKSSNNSNTATTTTGGGLSAIAYGIHLESHSKDEDFDNNKNNNSLSCYSGIQSTSTSSSGGAEKIDLDEGLIITCICKILGVFVGRKKNKSELTSDNKSRTSGSGSSRGSYSHGMKCAALNVLLSICNHAKDYSSSSSFSSSVVDDDGGGMSISCASIEHDMICSIGSHLIDALCDNLLYLYNKCLIRNERGGRGKDDGDVLKGLSGCLKVCASVISLLGMKLVRSEKSIKSLREVTWFVLNNLTTVSSINNNGGCNSDDLVVGVQKAGAVLLSTLALVGSNLDGTTIPPSNVWSNSLSDGIMLLRWAIHDFFPMPSFTDGGSSSSKNGNSSTTTSDVVKVEARKYPNLWKDHETWLAIAKEVPSSFTTETTITGNNVQELNLSSMNDDPTDTHRSQSLQYRISCLTSYIHSLLTMEGYPLHSSSSSAAQRSSFTINIVLPLDTLLDISEILLSFPLAAEAKHRSTKSRLRSTPMRDGLISPNSAVEIASNMKLCGHTLLDITVESCRRSGCVLSRARRIVGMSVATFQSSCSLPLVSAVDGSRRGYGSGSSNSNSRMGSWLRESIPLRIKSIQTFHCVSISLGSGVMASTGTVKSMSRALVLLGGCLLEQVNGEGDGIGEWGTLGDRVKLV